MTLRRTTIEVDEELLAKAQRVLGTSGLKDTVDAAFDEAIRADLRRRLADRIKTRHGIELSDKVHRESKEWRKR